MIARPSFSDMGERRTARGETGWGGTFLKADGLTSHRDVILEMVMDRGAWHVAIHGVTKSRTRLSD